MKHLLLTTVAAVVLVGCGAYTSIHEAARVGNVDAVKKHLAAARDVNAKDNNGSTPLHNASSVVYKEIVELLMAEGANVNAKNNSGDTPLDWAIINDETETADLLRKHGGKTAEELKALRK